MSKKLDLFKIAMFGVAMTAAVGCAKDYSQTSPAAQQPTARTTAPQQPAKTTTSTTYTAAAPAPSSQTSSVEVVPVTPAAAPAAIMISQPDGSIYDKPGFTTEVVDGRLWVYGPGESHSEKHITLIGAGPGGMTIKALDKQTGLSYLAAKNGFDTEIEDGRVWVLAPGQEMSEKHITIIGQGPYGMTIKAVDRDTALAYIAAKDGFQTEIEDGRIWVTTPGQEKSEKHITLVGAGPYRMTVKAIDRETALKYIATTPGFNIEIEDGRLWVLRPGEEKSEKHVTRVGAGPLNSTLKAIDRETLDAYKIASRS